MRKSLVTLVVSLLLCGGATAAVIAADTTNTPVKLAMVTTPPAMRIQTQAPNAEGPGFPGPGPRGMNGPGRGEALARFCQDRYAHTVGDLAYLEARLQLNAQQSSAFARWRTVRLDASKRQAATCADRSASRDRQGNGRNAQNRNAENRFTPPSPVDRMAREETMLKQRLADLEAERPALDALYNTLTPAQRQRFGLRGLDSPGGFMRGGPMGPRAMGPGAMGRGPMNGGPMAPPEGPGAPPPPPQP